MVNKRLHFKSGIIHIMMKQILPFAIIALLITAVSCKKYQYPPDYSGTWANSNALVTLNTDSTYQISVAGTGVMSGTFRTGANTLYFFDNSGACVDTLAGVYDWRYRVEGNATGTFYTTLTLTKLDDACPSRAGLLSGKFSKE